VTERLPDDALDRVFRHGRTANRYQARPVSDDMLRELYDLLKWGPTSTNQQPLRIVWCRTTPRRRSSPP
jgi:3-hydroxypropanoate dehydrogenase